MLVSDSWQPSVLQLLPFSSNDACTFGPQTSGVERIRQPYAASPAAESCRGFPVLAVTRGHGGGSRSGTGQGAGLSPRAKLGANSHRCESERLPRSSQAAVDLIARSHSRRRRSAAGVTTSLGARTYAPEYRHSLYVSDAVSDGLLHALDGGTLSPGQPARSGGVEGGGAWPRPVYQQHALSPSNTSASGVLGQHPEPVPTEGRYLMASKNGLLRSVTLTPGELELKKHRDQLDRVTSARQKLSPSNAVHYGDTKLGRQYLKMNVRDLPRSSTPLNDHDPDRLSMKQVFAFLQTKGQSQAGAVELPCEVKFRVKQDVQLPSVGPQGAGAVRPAGGQLKGRVKRLPVPPTSSAADICTRVSIHSTLPSSGSPAERAPSSVPDVDRIDAAGGECTLPSTRASFDSKQQQLITRSRLSGRAVSEYRLPQTAEPHNNDRQETNGEQSKSSSTAAPNRKSSKCAGSKSQQQQKKPFRLNRFLTMVPSPRNAVLPAFAASSPTAHATPSSRPATHSVSEATSKAAQKELKLCLDLANQSKAQTIYQRSKTVDADNIVAARRGSSQAGSEVEESSSSSVKVRYRISAVGDRSRPDSLRVEQGIEPEAHDMFSADFRSQREHGGGRVRIKVGRDSTYTEDRHNNTDKADSKNVIRLPFALVDSEEEENGTTVTARASVVREHSKRGENARLHQHAIHRTNKSAGNPSKQKYPQELKAERQPEAEVVWGLEVETDWALRERDTISDIRLENGRPEKDVQPELESATQSASSLSVNPEHSTTSMTVSPLDSSSSMEARPYQSAGGFRPIADPSVNGLFTDSATSMNGVMELALSLSTSVVINATSSNISLDSEGSGTDSHSDYSLKETRAGSAIPFPGNPATMSVISTMTTSQSELYMEQYFQRSDAKFPNIHENGRIDVGVDNIYHDLNPKVTRRVKVNVPSSRAGQPKQSDDGKAGRPSPDYVTLSLRKERNRTRESTYMSELGGRATFSDETSGSAASFLSSNVRPSASSDGSASWIS